jgi:hypothetical protein
MELGIFVCKSQIKESFLQEAKILKNLFSELKV